MKFLLRCSIFFPFSRILNFHHWNSANGRVQSYHMTTVTFHLWRTLFPQRDWYFTFCSCAEGAASCFRCWKHWRHFSSYVTNGCDWSTLASENPNRRFNGKIYGSQMTCYQSFSFIVAITRNCFLIQGSPPGDAAGKPRPISSCAARSEPWPRPRLVLEKLPPMNMKTLRRLTRNLHHREVVFGPLTPWHHSVFPFDLCRMPTLRPSGGCSASNFHLTHKKGKKKKSERTWNVMCLLVLMVATDAPLEGTPKTQFCNFQTFFSVSSPDVKQDVQAFERPQRLKEITTR